ncbi:MAG: hypothetical protein V1846_03660 [Candidatus Komeilibacteria bacterium]
MILQLIITLLITALAVIVVWQTLLARHFPSYIPSNMKLLRQALTQLPLTSRDRFIDIGSGDGRAVILAAKEFQLTADGIEIAPILCWWSRLRINWAGVAEKTQIITGDLYQLNLGNYSIIYIFGLPQDIQTWLKTKLDQELKSGTYVISYCFSLPGRQPITTLADRWRKIMIYRF